MPNLTADEIRAMCASVQLDIPDDRAERLASNLGSFLDSFTPVWDLDLDQYEPPTIVPASEALADEEARHDSER
jgi:hypothetical protein